MPTCNDIQVLIGSKLVKVCTNTEGSFNCKAAKGFRSDTLSISDEYIDIDECTEGGHLCDINAYCYNVPGKSSQSKSISNAYFGTVDFPENSPLL